MSDDGTEYVSVLVPKKHLTRVYGFIAELEQNGTVSEAPLGTVASELEDGQWPHELIARQYVESQDFMKSFQQYLADNPGKEFSTSEIATALGAEYGWNTVAGALGAYGRRVKNRYKRSTFPWDSRTDYNEGQVYHSMSSEVADLIKDL